ncbi:hypothetical protein M5X11_25090 [Paenibacillus alginolyticus]|uniref:hypothetical protein n=1 Tax=Paenibacillus alginolyticus TaxID=59839 RepID=UPI0004107B71|nr:hypothetical protein [Paenibacillus alginolyticus]MCY9668158.1 hypothetical protein [Paenibacillus alginolyticus]
MSDNTNNVDVNKTSIFKNGVQSAMNYVQNAIENVAESTQDATQNLVNNVMKKRQSDNRNNK